MPGFAPAPVGGAFGRDHVQRHPQRDRPVDRRRPAGELVVAVLDGDLVAEEPRRAGSGVGDQGFVRVEFQREFVAQERAPADS